jgi:hypothetical protein
VNTSGADQSAAGNVVLSAVLISPSRRIAVINGQLCREGDVVADARVERIDPRSVSLRRDGELIVVALNAPRPPESTNDGDPN